MKILLLSDVYLPRINGVSTSLSTLRSELLRRGHEVTLIAPFYESCGLPEPGVIRIPGRRVLFDPEDRVMRLRPLRRLRGQWSVGSFDLVHIHTPFMAHRTGLQLASRLCTPVVETYHTYFEEYFHHYVPFLPRRASGSLARALARAQCNRVQRVVAPSPAIRQVLRNYGVRRKVEVIPTGVSIGELEGGSRTRFRRRHGIAEERPVLLHVGRVAHEKNILFLLAALERVRARVPDVLLLLAGEGPALPSVRSRVSERNLADAVRFTGYLSRDGSLQDCYAAADLFVFASRTETQGLVLLEAMACGLPVVSTAVMGTVDIVGSQRGAAVADEEPEDFSQQIITLLSDGHRREQMGREAIAFSRQWSVESMTDRMLELYEEVLSERGW